jgi:hypothetical protein
VPRPSSEPTFVPNVSTESYCYAVVLGENHIKIDHKGTGFQFVDWVQLVESIMYWRIFVNAVINSVWNKKELPDQWKESITVPIHKKGDKTDCNNYRGISMLSTSYTILSNILLSRLVPYIDEIIEEHQCGFRRNRSTTDQIFCIRQILEKNGSTMRQYTSYL